MKNGFWLFFALLLTGCDVYRPYVQEERLTAIPTPAHQDPVEVFFLGESRPERPYLRVSVLKARGRDAGEPTALVKSLEQQAREKGCDAVVVTGQDHYEEVRTDLFIDDTYSVSGQSMIAIGIKYVDQLPRADQFVCEKVLMRKTGEDWQRIGAVIYGLNGHMEEIQGGANEMYLYSLDHLLYETRGWEFHQAMQDPSYPYSPAPLNRRRGNGSFLTDQVKVFYRPDTLPGAIRLITVGGRPVNSTMSLVYNDDGRLLGRRWETPQGALTSRIRYDAEDRVRAEYFYREEEPERDFLMFDYRYCTPADWEQALQREQVIYPPGSRP